MTNPYTVAPPGMISYDYKESYDQWYERVVFDLITRYIRGEGGASTTGGAIGSPDPNDFGSAAGAAPGYISNRTQQYWENFVKNYGAQSPYIVDSYGPPPTRNATYELDPNSPASISGTFKARSEFEAAEAAKDRALTAAEGAANRAVDMAAIEGANARAAMQEAGATARTAMQIDASWREATLADATRRYVAEGDWGVQKWVTGANNTAAMERLQAQLGFDREALAQQAIQEKNRHQEQLVGLAIEVAKYDAELAASPRNLFAYAAWLQNRNIPVNGLSLAMAAQEVAIDTIDPGEVADATGSTLAALDTAMVQEETAGGANVQATPQELQQLLGSGGQELTATKYAGGAIPQNQPPPSAEQLGKTENYQDLASQLLGQNPLAPNESDVSTSNLQGIMNNLQTAGTTQTGFGNYSGPRTNALGVKIPEVTGQETDYRQFSKLLPTEQGMKLAGVESVRGPSGITDYVKELERSRPKGGATGVASYG